MKQFQQGDVVLQTIKIPKKDYEIITDPIVQHGEHTGHKHALQFRHEDKRVDGQCNQWEMFKEANGTRYLKVNEPTDLTHEEHKTITLPPGEYQIRIVQEYDHFLEEARQVQD